MKYWSKSEINFLKNNYKKLKYSEISNRIKRTESSIWTKCYQLKLNKGYHNLWNKRKVINKLNEFSKKLGHSPSAREVSIPLLRACERYFESFNNAKKVAKLTTRVNLNFLSKECYKPSKELAYVTGVVLGDGSIRIQKSKKRTSYVIIFATVDEDFMEKFINDFYLWSKYKPYVKVMSGGYKRFPSGKFYKYRKFFCTQIPFKSACLFLSKFKINPKYCLKFFPKKYLKWVIKGLWDSEGNVRISNKKYLRIVFVNYDKDIIHLFREILDKFSIPYSLQKFGKRYPHIEILTNEGRIKFVNLVGGFTIKRKMSIINKSKLILNYE